MANGWQPIDTAPLDGETVDLFCLRSWQPPRRYERKTDVYWDRGHKCWRTEGVLHYVESIFKPPESDRDRRLIPTHWRRKPFGPNGEPL